MGAGELARDGIIGGHDAAGRPLASRTCSGRGATVCACSSPWRIPRIVLGPVLLAIGGRTLVFLLVVASPARCSAGAMWWTLFLSASTSLHFARTVHYQTLLSPSGAD